MNIKEEAIKTLRLQEKIMRECLSRPVTKLSTNNSHIANECDYKEKQNEI